MDCSNEMLKQLCLRCTQKSIFKGVNHVVVELSIG